MTFLIRSLWKLDNYTRYTSLLRFSGGKPSTVTSVTNCLLAAYSVQLEQPNPF